ncbi:ATP-binding protein [Cellulomonas endophytica]|uniref:ATP-binding protein n=1 Tax=Cellulomonas endophytica TaxID=2494735 RepID=UPI0013E95EC0|nr:AAA family ATPase [Cellulomonas endophytica]
MRGLPAPVSSLVGREGDVVAVASLLERTTARLVTLTGTGGVGKTVLAHAVARAAVRRYRDGVVVVPLAGVDDAALVLPALGRALGLAAAEAQTADEAVLAALRPQRALVVLDNLEHLAQAPDHVARVLAECPDVVVLATSRAALRLRGESEYAVQPLALPIGPEPGLEAVAASPAGALLLERARAVQAGFGTRPSDAPALAALCRRLAGIPLALELAAARARVLDAPTLLARLEDATNRAGASDLPERQRTLRSTLDWSYRLLTGDEQTLLRRMSVLVGGGDLAAVEALGDDLDDALGSLERLVEHSLVVVLDDGSGARYSMLEPVQQHARGLLAPAELAAVRGTHARHFRALALEAAPHYELPDQVLWLDRSERDDGNLAAALEWYLEARDGGAAGTIVWALWLFWWLRGHLRRGRRLAEAALTLPLPDAVRVRVTLTVGVLTFAQGDLAASAPRWQEAEALARTGEDPEGVLYGLTGHGLVLLAQSDLARAGERFDAALAHAAATGQDDAWVVPLVQVWLGTVRLLAGDPDGAVRHVEPGLRAARARGDRLATYTALYNLVQAALAQGRRQDARGHLVEGIRLSEETGDPANTAYFLESLAVVEGADGRYERVADLLGAAAALRGRAATTVYGFYLPDPALRVGAEDAAREALGPAAFASRVRAASALDAAAAVALAVGDDASA